MLISACYAFIYVHYACAAAVDDMIDDAIAAALRVIIEEMTVMLPPVMPDATIAADDAKIR